MRADLKALGAFPTRFAASSRLAAVQRFLWQRLAELGLEPVEQAFPLKTAGRDTEQINLFVRLASEFPLRPRLLILAHYDSINEGWEGEIPSHQEPESPAPGADDNGSGVVVLLECLRLLLERPLPRDVIVLFTAAEEIGQAGSRRWVEAFAPENRRIAWVLNLDQVGKSRGSTRGLRVFTRGEGIPFARRIRDLGEGVSPELLAWRLLLDDTMGKSDHGPFLERGLPAVSLVEGSGYYPWEDQGAGDLPEKLDFGMLAAVARLVTAIARDPGLPPPDSARPPPGRE